MARCACELILCGINEMHSALWDIQEPRCARTFSHFTGFQADGAGASEKLCFPLCLSRFPHFSEVSWEKKQAKHPSSLLESRSAQSLQKLAEKSSCIQFFPPWKLLLLSQPSLVLVCPTSSTSTGPSHTTLSFILPLCEEQADKWQHTLSVSASLQTSTAFLWLVEHPRSEGCKSPANQSWL